MPRSYLHKPGTPLPKRPLATHSKTPAQTLPTQGLKEDLPWEVSCCVIGEQREDVRARAVLAILCRMEGLLWDQGQPLSSVAFSQVLGCGVEGVEATFARLERMGLLAPLATGRTVVGERTYRATEELKEALEARFGTEGPRKVVPLFG